MGTRYQGRSERLYEDESEERWDETRSHRDGERHKDTVKTEANAAPHSRARREREADTSATQRPLNEFQAPIPSFFYKEDKPVSC